MKPLFVLSVAALCVLAVFAGKALTPAKLRSKGDTAFVSGKPDGVKKALRLYTQAIDMEPDNHENYYKRYRAWLRLKKDDKALRDLTKAVKVNPNFQRGHLHRGKMLRKKGKCEEAAEALEKAFALKSTCKTTKKEYDAAKEAGRVDDYGNIISPPRPRRDITETPDPPAARRNLTTTTSSPYYAVGDTLPNGAVMLTAVTSGGYAGWAHVRATDGGTYFVRVGTKN